MKKLITILAIMIVLVGAIFAASEAHTININAVVEEIIPQFQLKVGNVSTNPTPTAFTNNASYTADARPNTGANIILSGTGTTSIEVIAYLANAAKTAQNYSLVFSEGVFVVTRNGVPSSGTEGANKNVIPTITNVPVTTNNGFSASGTGATVTVDFNGKTCAAGNITTATYTYQQEDGIVPATYQSTVKLTISTT